MRLNLESLICDLPEDVTRKKYAGDFAGEKARIEALLCAPNLAPMLRDRLTVELAVMDRAPRRFPYTREAAIQKMRGLVPDFTDAEFDEMENDGCMEFIYAGGEKKYLSSFAGTLFIMRPALALRKKEGEPAPARSRLDEAIDEIEKTGALAYTYRVRSEMKLSDSAFTPGETYTVHMPVPAACAQQKAEEIQIIADKDAFVSAPDAFQRTARYARKLETNEAFRVEYAFTSRLQYVNPFRDAPRIVYPDAGEPCADDLSEQAPHIFFTPYLRALARDIAGDETSPLRIARRVYDYITRNVRYSYMRSYLLIERHAEYAALNLKGDCGIQAILFITLCRILGIPARWQSGLTVDEKSTGNHDWAQFYTEEFGWLFADPSFGGGALRKGNEKRWNYYFGNLDPFRMIANRRYQTNFDPPKAFERFDPYDNQDGEIECGARGFDCLDFDTVNTTLEYIKRA